MRTAHIRLLVISVVSPAIAVCQDPGVRGEGHSLYGDGVGELRNSQGKCLGWVFKDARSSSQRTGQWSYEGEHSEEE